MQISQDINKIHSAETEWLDSKKFNPFNSMKLLCHIDRWQLIKKNQIIPPPVLITIDPANICNLKCKWCNSQEVISKRSNFLTKIALQKILRLLVEWNLFSPKYPVKSICLAGGGEPLLNNNVGFFIEELIRNHLDVGIVTNGIFINKFIKSLSLCHWVSVSVDAGTSSTYAKLKQTEEKQFSLLMKNIRKLAFFSSEENSFLNSRGLSFGITYKFLLYKENIHEVARAASIAKEIGCRSIHIRPAGTPWKLNKNSKKIQFSKQDIDTFKEQMNIAMQLNDDNFTVYGVTHKFDNNFSSKNNFLNCYAVFMTAVFMPSHFGDSPDSFVVGLCCDRRGDHRLELCRNVSNIKEVFDIWGSEKHWAIHEKICIDTCPRCTYSPHNEIFEKVVCQENMSIDFI